MPMSDYEYERFVKMKIELIDLKERVDLLEQVLLVALRVISTMDNGDTDLVSNLHQHLEYRTRG